MGKIFLTSDLHFGHDRPFLYQPRGFSCIEDHDAAVISNWNSVVAADDIVYVLGDLMLNDNEHGMDCLAQLNGDIKIILGNHDNLSRVNLYNAQYKVLGYADMITYKKYHFYLSHFPTMTGNFEKEFLRQVTCNLFGHTHSKEKFYNDIPFMYNVALDAHDCYPVELDKIIEDMNNKARACKGML